VKPYYEDEWVTLFHGDCLDVLRTLPDASVDSVVTDPPYGLEFMGKEWDRFRVDDPGTNRHRGDRAGVHGALDADIDETRPPRPSGVLFDKTKKQARGVAYGGGKRPTTNRCDGCGKRDQFRNPHACADGTPWTAEIIDPNSAPPTMLAFQAWCTEWARECLRVLKPGGHMLAFGGTRTSHRLACAIEDAGFEIRDSIAWLYGSGFPKSLDVSKAIDRAAGVEREVVGPNLTRHGGGLGVLHGGGIGSEVGDVTAPATPDAERWQGWGTALKPAHEPVVVARKPLNAPGGGGTVAANVLAHGTGALNVDGCRIGYDPSDPTLTWGEKFGGGKQNAQGEDYRTGSGVSGLSGIGQVTGTVNPAGRWPANVVLDEHQAAALDEQSGITTSNDPGVTHVQADGWGHSAERVNSGYAGDIGGASRFFYTAKAGSDERPTHGGTSHPTVKPLALMRWLVRLVTPPGGTCLEPFAGSGTTAEACLLERFHCIAIEREADYLPLILQRIHRRRDPIAYLTNAGHDLGLFGELA